MYVTPRPEAREDPLFGVRLGLMGVLAYAAVPLMHPTMPTIIAALPVGLIAAQRKRFSLGKAIGGPVMMTVMAWVMGWLVMQLRPMPMVYVGAMWLTYFAGFLMILKSGAPAGMLILVMAVLMSVMGMHGNALVETLRDGFGQASLVALIVAPLVYALVPPRTTEVHADNPVPSGGNVVTGAVIRASILLALSFWLYAVMQPSDMMMAIIAAMVLVFPSRRAVFSEARQRVFATCYGGVIALAILGLFTLSPHLPILLGLIFLGGWWLGHRMLHGHLHSNVYQYAFTVVLSLVAGALSTQNIGSALFMRIALALIGAFSAAFAVALLDALTGWREQGVRQAAHIPIRDGTEGVAHDGGKV